MPKIILYLSWCHSVPYESSSSINIVTNCMTLTLSFLELYIDHNFLVLIFVVWYLDCILNAVMKIGYIYSFKFMFFCFRNRCQEVILLVLWEFCSFFLFLEVSSLIFQRDWTKWHSHQQWLRGFCLTTFPPTLVVPKPFDMCYSHWC